jgi:hypothetical protein
MPFHSLLLSLGNALCRYLAGQARANGDADAGRSDSVGAASLTHQDIGVDRSERPAHLAGAGRSPGTHRLDARLTNMPRVFLSYRTGDGDFAAALLDLRLAEIFGGDNVFLASRSIEPGQDFAATILPQLQSCAIVLAVIGRHWLTVSGKDGASRIRDQQDWVHRELLAAEAGGITVVPVFLDDTPRLDAGELPADLAWLARMQYVRLRHRHVRPDVANLVNVLEELDRKLITVDEQDLRTYLSGLIRKQSATQNWLPHDRLDDAFVERRVSVRRDAPDQAAAGVLYADAGPVRGDVRWPDAVRELPIGVVLANAGAGKTWLLRHHCIRLCRAALAQLDAGAPVDDIAIPIFLHAHQLAVHWLSGLEPGVALLTAAVGQPGGRSDRRLRALLAARLTPNAPRLPVIIDAYDEVFDSNLADALDASIGWLTSLSRQQTGPSVLLSSRPTALRRQFTPFEPDEDSDDDPVVPRYLWLDALTENQVRQLWTAWFDARGSSVPTGRLDPVIAPLSAIRMAVRVPLIAAFCAWVAESATVVTNRAGLYGQVVDRFLGLHWKRDSPVDVGSLRHDPALRGRFRDAFTELAWRMATDGPFWADSLPADECETVLAAELAGAPGRHSRTFEARRLFGILVSLGGDDDVRSAPVSWIHRSVHQYLVATRLVAQSGERIEELVESKGWFRPEWRDVFDFAVGLEELSSPTEIAADADRPVAHALRVQALGDGDGLGWYATMFTAAAAGLPADPALRDDVVSRMWELHDVGLLSPVHLARAMALAPEAELGRIVDLVREGSETYGSRPEVWDALAWCGPPGIAALSEAARHASNAEGALNSLFRIAPDDAVAAAVDRLTDGLTITDTDRAVLSAFSIDQVEWLVARFLRDPRSIPVAQEVGWAGAGTRLLDTLRHEDPECRYAAVAGVAADFAVRPSDLLLDVLLGIALDDPERAVRVSAREQLLAVATDVPWVEAKLDERWNELHRDEALPALDDIESIAARLRDIGPSTITAVVMIQEEPELARSAPVVRELGTLLARARRGELDHRLTTQLTLLFGDAFAELVVDLLADGTPFQRDNLRNLVSGLCHARPEDPAVFEAVADRIAADPDPALGSALLLHHLSQEEKVRRLLRRLTSQREPNRAAVQVWSDVLRIELLKAPQQTRERFRADCATATAHIVGRPPGPPS